MSWKKYPNNKPKRDSVYPVYNNKRNTYALAMYYGGEFDYFMKYNCASNDDFPLNVTHFMDDMYIEDDNG